MLYYEKFDAKSQCELRSSLCSPISCTDDDFMRQQTELASGHHHRPPVHRSSRDLGLADLPYVSCGRKLLSLYLQR